MMSDIATIILILSLLEIFEVWWQHSPTMEEVLTKAYIYYKKSIFLFFIMHPAYYFTLIVILYTQTLNGWMIAILMLKTVDLFFKITLMRGLFEEGDISDNIKIVLKEPLSPIMFLTGLGIYPFLMFYGLI